MDLAALPQGRLYPGDFDPAPIKQERKAYWEGLFEYYGDPEVNRKYATEVEMENLDDQNYLPLPVRVPDPRTKAFRRYMRKHGDDVDECK